MRLGLVLTLILLATAAVAQDSYFPTHLFSDYDRADQFTSAWYSKQLKAMDEPSLWTLAQAHQGEQYRFLWLRSFHQPVAVRIEVGADGTSQLTAKVLSGRGGYDPGQLVINDHIVLSKIQTGAFLAQISDNNFWNLPSIQIVKNQINLDGAQWIIEAAKHGNYHLVERWSPDKGPVRDLGLFMVRSLAKLKISGPTY